MIGKNQKLEKNYDWEEINWELTQQAKEDKRYIIFKEWLKENGAIIDGVDFPVAFGPLGYIGVSAEKEIPPKKCIISIPNKLIISCDLVDQSELKEILEENMDMFDNEETDDADFNKLALFVMHENKKGKKSFWYPYFQLVEESYTLYDWRKSEVKWCQDEWILKSIMDFRKGMEGTWEEFKVLFKSYPDIFPKGSYSRDSFLWAYQFVMTRCYGWTMNSTSLVPFADMLNHSKYATDHLIYNKRFERIWEKGQGVYKEDEEDIIGGGEEEEIPKDYNIKQKQYDFSIFRKKNNEVILKFQEHPLAEYINKNKFLLKQEKAKQIPEFLEDKVREQLIDYVREINIERIKTNKDENLWDVPFFSTSDSEDNDTESEDEEEKSIEKNGIMHEVRIQESLQFEAMFSQMNLDQNKKQAYLKIQQSKELEIELYKKKGEKSKNHLNEMEWDWMKVEDQDNNFVILTERWQTKNKQIYNCYGRRNNRFLLQWYGFTYPNNQYDSYPFRMGLRNHWDDIYSEKILPQNIIFDDCILEDDWNDGKVFWNGLPIDISTLSKEFRLKNQKLCLHFLTFLRMLKLKDMKPEEIKKKYFVTMPTDLEVEIDVINVAIRIIQYLYDSKISETSIEEDEKRYLDLSISYKERFAIILRLEHKKIILQQLTGLQILKEILIQIYKGNPIKQATMEVYNKFETTETFAKNREHILDYLRQIFVGVVLFNP